MVTDAFGQRAILLLYYGITDSDDVVEHGAVEEHSVELQTDTISSSSNALFTLLARRETSPESL